MIARLNNRIEALVRQAYVRLLSGRIPFYAVNEYPKSGGTWIGLMLGAALHVDFPRHRIPSLAPSILHGHYLHPWGIQNAVCVWRDGRDVMVSWYHHCLFKQGMCNDYLVDTVSKDLGFKDKEDVYRNLPKFIEYVNSRQKHPNYSWSDFVRVWYDRQGVVHVKYEDFHNDATRSLVELVCKLTGSELNLSKAAEIAERFTFEKMSGREVGEENKSSFVRKGIVGDWKENFSPEAKEVFNYFSGEALIRLGYEPDRTWMAKVNASSKLNKIC